MRQVSHTKLTGASSVDEKAPDARYGHHEDGVGRRLLGELERTAGEAGVVVLRLETNRALSEAIALYKRSGYAEVKAFNAEPYAHHWFEKTLGKKTQTGRVQ